MGIANQNVSKRDVLYADEFTLYLMGALYKGTDDHICKKSTITTLFGLSSISRYDNRKNRDKHFVLYQEYADDISVITSDKNKIDHIKKAVCKELEIRNFRMNKLNKTEMNHGKNENY